MLIFNNNFVMETLAVIILVTLLVAELSEIKLQDESFKYFVNFTLSVLFAAVLDLPTWLLLNDTKNTMTLNMLLGASYCLQILSLVFFTYFLVYNLNKTVYVSLGLCTFVNFYSAAVMLISFVLTISGQVYTYPGDGTFIYSGFLTFLSLAPFIPLLMDILLVFNVRRVVSRKDMLIWLLVPGIALIGTLLETVTNGSAMFISTAVAALIVYLNQHLTQSINMAQKNVEIAEAKSRILLSQMQPHFMYNSLNSIYYLVDFDKEKAKDAILTFSDYLRGNVSALSAEKPIEFEKELKHVKAYVDLEKIRFEDDLNVVYNIGTTDFRVPALCIQTLVENAVKHGVCEKEGGGTVTLTTRKLRNCYEITILDDGVGMDIQEYEKKVEAGTAGIGIAAAKERIETQVCGTFEIHSLPGSGTEVRIRIPDELKKNI